MTDSEKLQLRRIEEAYQQLCRALTKVGNPMEMAVNVGNYTRQLGEEIKSMKESG